MSGRNDPPELSDKFELRGIVYLMSFHVDGTSADPMTIEQSSILSRKFAISGYPSCVVDMRGTMGLSENYSVMRAIFNESLKIPAHCGEAISLFIMRLIPKLKLL